MSGNLNELGITLLRRVDLAVPDFESKRTFYRDTWCLTEQGKDGNLSYSPPKAPPSSTTSACGRPMRSREHRLRLRSASSSV